MSATEDVMLRTIKTEPDETEFISEFIGVVDIKSEVEDDNVKIEWVSSNGSSASETNELLPTKATFEMETGHIPKSEVTLGEFQLGELQRITEKQRNIKRPTKIVNRKWCEPIPDDLLQQFLEGNKDIKHACDQCDKKFLTKNNLKSHKLLHPAEKQFACDQCNMKFVQKIALTSHRRVHTEKMYTCDKCDKRFPFWGIANHQRTHSQTYACDRCEKTFLVRTQLTQHKRIHTRKKRFACDGCDMKFAMKKELTQHRLLCGVDTYACDKCEMKFYRKYNLIQHCFLFHIGERRPKLNEEVVRGSIETE